MEGRSRLVLLRHRSDGRFSDGWRPLVRDRRGWNGGAACEPRDPNNLRGVGEGTSSRLAVGSSWQSGRHLGWTRRPQPRERHAIGFNPQRVIRIRFALGGCDYGSGYAGDAAGVKALIWVCQLVGTARVWLRCGRQRRHLVVGLGVLDAALLRDGW